MGEQSSIEQFTATHQKSRGLYEKARRTSRGYHHDGHSGEPFPIYISYAKGSRKWDVDGNQYIDYAMGHSALLLGHAHPSLVEAVLEQVRKGTLYGSCHELADEWASLITQLVPSAERVEFIASGNEANVMAAQIARAYTGKHKIAKFQQHFLGWTDHMYVGIWPPYDKPFAGRVPSIWEDTVAVPINDAAALEEALSKKDIAAVFIEAQGAHNGAVAMPLGMGHTIREMTRKYEALFVLDEVVTGFRWSPGGWQEVVGVTPDLTTLGKTLGGGLPCGAICGRADIMEMLENKDSEWNRYRKIRHSGTWNGNPICAAAGVAMLKRIATGEPQKVAEQANNRLMEGLNHKMEERSIEGCAYGPSSALHLHLGRCQKCDRTLCLDGDKTAIPGIGSALQRNLLLNGVDLLGNAGWVSAVHSEEDINQTIEAFGRALDTLIAEGALSKA